MILVLIIVSEQEITKLLCLGCCSFVSIPSRLLHVLNLG